MEGLSEEWLEGWITSHGDRITQFAFTYTRDWQAAQDVAQETFLRLFTTHSSRPEAHISPGWLYQVAHHLCVDMLRKQHKAAPSVEPPDLSSGLHDGTDVLAVHEVMNHLRPRDRECLWLAYYEDLSIAETAKALHLSPEAVRTRLRRARDRFRAQWEVETSGATS
ncbi:MAG: sigma-70 family RNA polymerase sigma factor [Thermaerobacter sp.]|nr:sigma-70 family RNA polymerase sigma factor [Thermaerobacter sp.]